MPNTPTLPNRKNVFTVHSAITVLVMELIIKYYKLDPNQCYVLSRSSCLQAVLDLNLIPRQNILNTEYVYDCIKNRYKHENNMTYFQYYEDNYISHLIELNTVFTLLDDNVDPQLKIDSNCQLGLNYFKEVDWDALKHNKGQKLYEPYDQPTAPDHNLDFNLFTQHCADPFFNTLVQSKHCRCIKYCEEGSINYLDYDEYLYEDFENNYKFIEDRYPQYSYEYLGIKRIQFGTMFRLDEIGNPNLDLEQSGFIGLSDVSFSLSNMDHVWKDKEINLDVISSAITHHIKKEDNYYYQKQQRIYTQTPEIANNESVKQALADPYYMGNYVNIIVCENYVENKVSQAEFLEAHKTLFKRVVDQGVFFFFIKFHPLCDQHTRQLLIDFLNQSVNCFFEIINDEVCLERIFCESAPFTFIVHTIYSSLGIYAAKFSQLTFPYCDLYAKVPFYIRLHDFHGFDLKNLIDHFNKENNVNLSYRVQ